MLVTSIICRLKRFVTQVIKVSICLEVNDKQIDMHNFSPTTELKRFLDSNYKALNEVYECDQEEWKPIPFFNVASFYVNYVERFTEFIRNSYLQ